MGGGSFHESQKANIGGSANFRKDRIIAYYPYKAGYAGIRFE
jgi:hypothetical protein